MSTTNEPVGDSREDQNLEQNTEFSSGIIRKAEYFDLFISYKRDHGENHGQALAEELYEKLTKDGYKVWIDNQEIGYSNDFETRIEEAILHSKKFLAVLSLGWVGSPHCMGELKIAAKFNKRIIPVYHSDFRALLSAKNDDGTLTDEEWRRIDKPQEVFFGDRKSFPKSYTALKALCRLKDEDTKKHTKILCESYYWKNYKKPKGMLLDGGALSKARTVKSRCDSDPESPSFTEIQNEFIQESQKYVSSEVSLNRKVFISFDPYELDYASELDIELRLHNITTWFDAELAGERVNNDFIEPILNCENVIDVITDLGQIEDDYRIEFARSKNKPVIRITDSLAVKKEQEERGIKNVYFWNGTASIDSLIARVNGDKLYNAAHAKLLSEAFQWIKRDKEVDKLLSYKEALTCQEWYLEAEKLGKEPQPNVDMINFVDRSVNYAEAAAKKRRLIFWATFIGIAFLVISIGLAFYFNEEQRIATIAKAEAVEAQNLAIENENRAKIQKNEADLRTIEAEKEAKVIEDRADSLLNLANKKVSDSRNIARIAEKRAFVADTTAKGAETRAELAESKIDDAEQLVADAEKKKEEIEEASRTMKLKAMADIAAIEAKRYVQDEEDAFARDSADKAMGYISQSDELSSQTEILYEVYTELLPSKSIFSLEKNQDGKELSALEASLTDSIKENKYPISYDSIVVNNTTFPVGSGTGDFPSEKIQELINTKKIDEKLVSALCIDSLGNRLAIGNKNGRIEIWDLNTQNSLGTFKEHLHRITSLCFSPNGTQLAMSSIDENFSLVELVDSSGLIKDYEVIIRNNGTRIQRLYYWNNNAIITVSWNDISKIWSTNVGELKREVELELESSTENN